jgi:hypothetical protein
MKVALAVGGVLSAMALAVPPALNAPTAHADAFCGPWYQLDAGWNICVSMTPSGPNYHQPQRPPGTPSNVIYAPPACYPHGSYMCNATKIGLDHIGHCC